MFSTKPLKAYDCSVIEYITGRKILDLKSKNPAEISSYSNSSITGCTKVKAQPICKPKSEIQESTPDSQNETLAATKMMDGNDSDDDEKPQEKRVRWNERELKVIRSKCGKANPNEIYSEGGVRINKRHPKEQASECPVCNRERFGVPMICDTCIRKQGNPSCRESKKVKKKQKAKNGDNISMSDQTKNDWWDGNKPTWCTDNNPPISWEQSATSEWGQKTNECSGDAWETKFNPTTWDTKKHETSWVVNPEFSNSTGWDLNQNSSTWDYHNDKDNNKCTWNSNNNCSSWGDNQHSNNLPGWDNDGMQRNSNSSAPWNDLPTNQGDVVNSFGCDTTNSCGNYVNPTPRIVDNSGRWSNNVQNGAWNNRHDSPENNCSHREGCWHNNQCKTSRNRQSGDKLQNRFQAEANPSSDIQDNTRSRKKCVCNWRNSHNTLQTGGGCSTCRINFHPGPAEHNRLCGNQGLWQKNTHNGLSSTCNARVNTDRLENYHNSLNNESCCGNFRNSFHDEGYWFENQGQSVHSQRTVSAGVPSFCPTGTNTGDFCSEGSWRLPPGTLRSGWIWVSSNTAPHPSQGKTNDMNRRNSSVGDRTCPYNKLASVVQTAHPFENQHRFSGNSCKHEDLMGQYATSGVHTPNLDTFACSFSSSLQHKHETPSFQQSCEQHPSTYIRGCGCMTCGLALKAKYLNSNTSHSHF